MQCPSCSTLLTMTERRPAHWNESGPHGHPHPHPYRSHKRRKRFLEELFD